MRTRQPRLGALFGVCLCVPCVVAGPATAETRHLHYVAYAAGLRVLDLQVDLDMGEASYRVAAALRTVGLFGAMVTGATTTEVLGSWNGLAPVPAHYASTGTWRGRPLRVLIDYLPGGPRAHDLLPDPDPEPTAPVPTDLQVGTIDSLSAMAGLLRQVRQTATCDGEKRLFDGKRLSRVVSNTIGAELLKETSRSIFEGQALRCDFTGHLLAGFRLDEEPAYAARPHGGSAWFAALEPGGALLPVRITFETRFFGNATLYLAPQT